MNQLANKVAVITGASSGIGLATAKLFLQQGAKVAVFARDSKTLEAAANQLEGNAGNLLTLTGDVAQSADLERLFDVTRARFGSVDVLFANAAVVRLAPIAKTDDALLDEVVGINMIGTFKTIRVALPVLNDGASVICTTSYFNRIGFPGASVVSMTKAAVRSLVRVAANELAPRRIRVNALCPGAVETPLWGKLGLAPDVLMGAAQQIVGQTPAGRFGTAEELARAALFLASDAASFINGIELSVDGGLHQV